MKTEIIKATNDATQLKRFNGDLNGLNEILKAIDQEQKIIDYGTPEALKQALRYVFVLIGLKDTLIPTEFERDVLIENILKRYGYLRPEEIKIAFRLALEGQLLDDKKQILDINLYGDAFSYEYFSKIIRAYESQKRREALFQQAEQDKKEMINQEPTEDQKKKNRIEFVENCIIKPIEAYLKNKKGGLNFTVSTNRVFEYFVKSGLIQLSKEEKEEIRKRNEKEIIERFEAEVYSLEPPLTKEQSDERKKMRAYIEGNNQEYFNKILQNTCKLESIILICEQLEIETIKSKLIEL